MTARRMLGQVALSLGASFLALAALEYYRAKKAPPPRFPEPVAPGHATV